MRFRLKYIIRAGNRCTDCPDGGAHIEGGKLMCKPGQCEVRMFDPAFKCPLGHWVSMLPGSEGIDDPALFGNAYREALKQRFGGMPCGACTEERRRMNAMTKEQCIREREDIVDQTISRAMESPRWFDRMRAKLGNAVAPELLRKWVGECFDEAIAKHQPPQGEGDY